MTRKELIERLSKMRGNQKVRIQTQDGESHDIKVVEKGDYEHEKERSTKMTKVIFIASFD